MDESSNFNLDTVVKVLSHTLFSPFFCAFLPLSLYGNILDIWHPAVMSSGIWTIVICLIAVLRHVDRVYRNGSSWLFASSKLDWERQIVLITGGGTGIGALLAETLTMRNVTVVVLSKDPVKVDSNNDDIVDSLFTYICDVSNCQEVEAVAQRVIKEIGEPTVIVNNAGIVKGKLLLDLTEEDVNDTFGSNTLAHFWILKAFLPSMLKRGRGHIVTVSSLMGLVACAQMTDYCASKAAVINLHQSLRFELDNRYKCPRIRTTLLLPSFITTSLFSKISFPNSRLYDFLAPPVQPHEVVKAIISALDEDESRVIRMPFYTQIARFWTIGVGIAPTWLVDLVQWMSGADHAMVGYGPRPDAAERLQMEKKDSEMDDQ